MRIDKTAFNAYAGYDEFTLTWCLRLSSLQQT